MHEQGAAVVHGRLGATTVIVGSWLGPAVRATARKQPLHLQELTFKLEPAFSSFRLLHPQVRTLRMAVPLVRRGTSFAIGCELLEASCRGPEATPRQPSWQKYTMYHNE